MIIIIILLAVIAVIFYKYEWEEILIMIGEFKIKLRDIWIKILSDKK